MKIVFATTLIALNIFPTLCGTGRHDNHYTTRYYSTGKAPGTVICADLNGDHLPDIVVANTGDSSVTVLLNRGHGIFRPANRSPFPAGANPNDLAICDINGDGHPDIAIANTEKKYVTVLLGDGKGSFSRMQGSPFQVNVKPHVHGIAVADFDGDGKPDLLTDSWGNDQLVILYAKQSFRVSNYLHVGKHPYQRARAADLNGDGRPDIVTTNLDGANATVLLNKGNGNFKEAPGSPFYCGYTPFGVAIGDLNKDGYPDLAIINSPSVTDGRSGKDDLMILLNNGKAEFTVMKGCPFETGKGPTRVAIGDMDGDGWPDIAVTNYNDASVTIFYFRNEKLMKKETLNVAGQPDGIALCDIDGDGKDELLITCTNEDRLRIVK
jgi:hypothetical protein